jgi:hypothetical protein
LLVGKVLPGFFTPPKNDRPIRNQKLDREKFVMNKALLIFSGLVYFLFVTTSPLFADGGHKTYVGSKEFERIKKLAGNWEGATDFGQGPQTMKASYKLTSAGSALIETFHEGTPHEMVSVYHDNKDRKLTMTHYCAEHNQPKLVLQGMDDNKMMMDLEPESAIDVAKESHIHSAAIQFEVDDKMTHQWTSFKGGKKDMVVKIAFSRKK